MGDEPGNGIGFPEGVPGWVASPRPDYPSDMRTLVHAVALALCLAPSTQAGGPVTPGDDYLVLASRRCLDDEGWGSVARALAAKHATEVLSFEHSPDELAATLAERHPRLVGVVAMPDEAGRARVGEIHRLLRGLDDDPYLDARWGLITAATWADGMEMVRATRPLQIESMLANTPVPLEVVPDGAYFDEGVAGRRVVRVAGGRPWPILGDPHTADDFARTFDRLQPDLLVTSGRTNEERWMIGHTFDGGRVISGDDGLVALTPDGRETGFGGEGPMAMLGAGSCLLGFVPGPEVLPLRFVHAAGARQVVGYCSTTWHGAGGWDLYARFLDEPGRYDLAECAWLAQQDLVRRFHARFPDAREVSTKGFDERAVPEFREAVSRANDMPRTDDRFDDLAGLLWDRDALVVIGDPAWSVRLDRGRLPWEADLHRDGDRLVVDVHVRGELEEGPTPAIVLPERVVPGPVIEDAGLEPLVLDDLIFLPGLAEVRPGTTVTMIVEAPLVTPRPAIPDVEEARRRDILDRIPEPDRDAVRHVLAKAGGNESSLLEALASVPAERFDAMVHLVANLPPRDARELPASFLREQVDLAHESFEGSPWHEGVPRAVFLDAVLPHAHIDERRDDWRRDFVTRFRELAWGAPSQEEAVRTLNREIYRRLDIVFDANRRLTNEQSPYQSIRQGCASCTGMSILLANACRAAGIPARLAGIPEWPTGDNHTWVEVFDPRDGRWHWVEAYGDGGYDRGWWVEKVRTIAAGDPDEPRHRIWAAGWTRPATSDDVMPLWWLDEDDDPIPGVDRTADYAVARPVASRP